MATNRQQLGYRDGEPGLAMEYNIASVQANELTHLNALSYET